MWSSIIHERMVLMPLDVIYFLLVCCHLIRGNCLGFSTSAGHACENDEQTVQTSVTTCRAAKYPVMQTFPQLLNRSKDHLGTTLLNTTGKSY